MDTLSQALAQIMQTGLFQIEQDETTQQTQLILNEDLLQQKIKALPPETSQKSPIFKSLLSNCKRRIRS